MEEEMLNDNAEPRSASKENVDAVMEYLGTWDKAFRGLKALIWGVVGVFGVTLIVVVFAFLMKFAQLNSQIYVLDQGRSLIALQSDGAATRDQEVKDHVRQFHEFFFNIAPNAEAIKQNVDRAFMLCDRSAFNYYNDLNEKGYYQRMITANITQQMIVDSVDVNVSVYPYKAHVFAKHYMIRESNITAYLFESTCELINVQRSDSNPHGLMMEKFTVTKNEAVDTRTR